MIEIPGYEIIKPLGSGGMAIVYLAKDKRLGRLVAIKVLLENLSLEETTRQRFFKEAQVLASLTHPNIVVLHDFIEFGDRLGLVMEFINGRTLDHMIGKEMGPFPHEKALPIFTRVLSGVSYAHKKGIIHRDLKPGNIMISEENDVKVADFGIAKILGEDGFTKTGLRKPGTIYYQAPEVFKGSEATGESDIYALGMTLYEMLAGVMPLEKETDSSELQIMLRVTNDELPDPRDFYPPIPKYLVDIVKKATSKDPRRRFQTCDEMLDSIRGRKEIDDAVVVPVTIPPKKQQSSYRSTQSKTVEVEKKASSIKKNSSKSIIKKFLPGAAVVVTLITVAFFFGVFGEGTGCGSTVEEAIAVVDTMPPPPPSLAVVDSIPFGPWFRDISMVALKPGGGFAVLDGERLEVNIFDNTGEFLSNVDLTQTPEGSLARPVGFTYLAGGQLAISDLDVGGILVFDENGNYLETIDNFDLMAPCNISSTKDGFAGAALFVEGTGAVGYRVCRWNSNLEKHVLFASSQELSMNNNAQRASVYMDIPMIATSADGMLFTTLERSIQTQVLGYDSIGNIVMQLELEGPSVIRPEELIQSDIATVAFNFGLQNTGWQPDTLLPVVASLGVDSLSRLWVQRGTETQPVFDIYSTTGESLFTVSITDQRLNNWHILVNESGILAWPSDTTETQRIYRIAIQNDPLLIEEITSDSLGR